MRETRYSHSEAAERTDRPAGAEARGNTGRMSRENSGRIRYGDTGRMPRGDREKRYRSPENAADAESRAKKKRTLYIIFTAIAAVFIILLAVVLRGVSDNRAFNGYMEQARTSYYAGDFDTALSILRKAASIEQTDECLAMIAQCYESQGNYDKALETLRKMDTSNPQVSSWIDELEGRRDVIRQSNMVTVAGKQYKSDTSGLALDNMGLGNSVIPEILQLYALDNLSLAGNNISDISQLSQLGGLTTLNLRDNMITDISALASLTNLRTLYLDNNPIQDMSALTSLTNLTTLSIKGITLTESQLKKLASALPNCAIHSETTEEEMQDISFGGVTFNTDVTELNLSGMGLQNISALANCKNLQRLDLSGNSISDLSPLMDIPNLQWLNIAGNAVSDLRPLMGISSLRFLNASGNYFSTTVPLGNMTGLTELHLSDNNISDFSGLRKLRSLQTLGLSNCNLTDEALASISDLTGLRSLNIENNTSLSGEAVDDLQRALGACVITHSDLTYMVNIDGFSIASDSANIDLSGLNISDISNVGKFKNPEKLNLARNNISNLYYLQDAPNRLLIKNLDLSSNSVMDITPLSMLTNLETLDLSYNMINSELPLLSLSNLRTLNVTGTMLTESQVSVIKSTLTGCNVISDYDNSIWGSFGGQNQTIFGGLTWG